MQTPDNPQKKESTPDSMLISTRPHPIDHQFHGPDVPTLLTWAFGFFGIAGVVIGAILFVPQMMAVGAILLVLAVWVYFGWRNMQRHSTQRHY